MCGIVGLFAKHPQVSEQLGSHIAGMLAQMGERGPDSAGVAIYSDEGDGQKLCFRCQSAQHAEQLMALLSKQLSEVQTRRVARHVVCQTNNPESVLALITTAAPDATLMSSGERMVIFKEAQHPSDFIQDHGFSAMSGSHALGHTRMATESAVTTAGSHPFSTGPDLCLVHNGSLSNHNRLRRLLQRRGVNIQTENDSEVAAGYLSYRMQQGDTLTQALEASLEDLDGFYTFAVGSRDGFAVLRDPIACKPAVLAETEHWVAMASEFRALEQLPGIEHANVWEPEPARVYSWDKNGAVQ